ncbi:AraC family transcriptional regulator [Devosia nitrariae]|uniref:AraC family transcriptional regulator n=1 Tax=Devosia nitrariae TaxID=2071872 RepID=A0ABQ5W1A0_9HYPH|nr:AraC family transcriptional regulator [Devosia nitrariae]GLQ53455.1 AraC family transcriptional regulator [Devosia nitrariae]
MTDARFQPSPLSDPLGEVLHMLRLTGTLYCRAEMTAPWGIVMPDLIDSMMFVIVTAGHGWLAMDGEEPVMIAQGSMVLLPHGASYRLLSAPDAAAEPLFDIPVEKVSDRYEIMRHGGGGAITRATAGVVQFDSVAAKRLVSLLPPVLRIDAWDGDAGDWLQSTLSLIAREASAMRPGGETVMTRLADILVIQAIRAWLDTAREANLGWLAALRDRQLGRALALMHRRPEQDWTVAELAREAGMSRSAFSARFTELVGQPAMQYLAQWRLHLARAQLLESSDSVGVVAGRAGYQSEAAFGRAFKQFFGKPPGAVRRLTT